MDVGRARSHCSAPSLWRRQLAGIGAGAGFVENEQRLRHADRCQPVGPGGDSSTAPRQWSAWLSPIRAMLASALVLAERMGAGSSRGRSSCGKHAERATNTATSGRGIAVRSSSWLRHGVAARAAAPKQRVWGL